MRTAYIILHFRDSAMTSECVESAKKAARSGDVVVVVDASHDFKASAGTEGSPMVHTVPTPQVNPGFARSMNLGASSRWAKDCEVLVFVNNDAQLPAGFSQALAEAFESKGSKLAAAGPKIVYEDAPNVIWSAGGKISPWKMKAIQSNIGTAAGTLSGYMETEFLSGCVVAIQREVFSRIGGWPERYLFGGEEWEMSRRLRSLGHDLAVLGDQTATHKADLDSGQGNSHTFQDLRFVVNSYLNRVLFADRNYGRLWQLYIRTVLSGYILLVMPIRWHTVGSEGSILRKFRVCAKLSLRIALRPHGKGTSWAELEEIASLVSVKRRSALHGGEPYR